MKHTPLQLFLLVFVLVVGFSVRIYGLDRVPYGFFCDEAAIGYNAYTILTNGKDEYGISYPFFFRSFGEYKSPVAIYSDVPLVKFFGLNEFSVRLQSVLYGLLTLVMIYLLAKELYSKNIGLLSAGIAATMPWLIHYNRIGFEFNSYAALFTATVYFFVKAAKHKKYILPAFLVASLALYTYYSAKLIVPLFLIGFLAIYGKTIFAHTKELTKSLGIFLILAIPFLISFLNGQGTARFNEVSVFSAKLSFSDSLLRIVTNYFFQLSPTLFLKGEPTFITRHFTGGLTPFLGITVPFFYIGIAALLYSRKKSQSRLLLWWLILYPIGAAVAADPPFTGRTIIGAPLSAILIALGITATVKFFKTYISHRISLSIIAAAVVLNFLFFLQFYFIKYPLYSSDFWGWQAGPKEIVAYFEQNKTQYDDEFMIGEFNAPFIFFKFYAPNGCEKCKLGVPNEVHNAKRRQLFAVSLGYLEQHPEIRFIIKKIIYYPNQKPAFFIGEVQ
jgi:4-amino-4-deoxy-L-arabinose transferase-like glycosyltransferase